MLLQTTDISKSYGTTVVLSNICLQVQEGERIGLVGINGAGKSTLLQIISGEITADQGQIHKAKETSIGYLAQNSGLDTDNDIWNEMLLVFEHLIQVEQELRELELKMAQSDLDHESEAYQQILQRYDQQSEWFRAHGGFEMEAKIRGVLHGMGFANFALDTSVRTLSGGQKTRLAMAKLLLQQPDILLLDEPTNHLDIPTLTWLEGYLKGYPGAIVTVSHDRYFLDALTNIIYEIERTKSKRYTGNYSRFIELKAAEYEIQVKHFDKQQGEIARMEDFVQRNLARASTTKRAQGRRKALERMDRLDTPSGELKKAHFSFELEKATGKDVLQVNELAASFDSKPLLFNNVTFQLKKGETVALIGPNGVGKSTLLKILIDQFKPKHGTIRWGANVQIGYYDQEQAALKPTHTILDEVWNDFPHLEEAKIRTVLGNFLFSGDDVLKKISALSGGEKARVSLAKLMLLNANVLILDEPTNHLDIYSKEILESSLMDYEGTLLFISHDRYFLNKMAERIIELTPNEANYFLGNYTDYVEKKKDLAEIREEEDNKLLKDSHKTSEPSINSYEAEKKAKQEERNKLRKGENLEQDILRLESEISSLEAELTQPEVYGDYKLVQEKNELIEAKKAELMKDYEEWDSLLS